MTLRGALSWLMVFLLWAAVVASSFAVVLSTYRVRSQTHQLEILRREASELRVEWGRYLLEQSTWASYSRIEQIAVGHLKMKVPEGNEIEIIINEEFR